MRGARSLRTFRLVATLLSSSVHRRAGRLAVTAAGVALAVALLASIAAFVSASRATMSARAIATVAVDWQVETQPGRDPAAVDALVVADPDVAATRSVMFATVSGFEHASGSTTQTTGPGQVVGLPSDYRGVFPGEIRDLSGASDGVLLFQQTAANLAARTGDVITIRRPGLSSVTVTIDGIVDLPQADSLFQRVGVPAGGQLLAPPDNVLLLPDDEWHRLFDRLAVVRPDQVRSQTHARLEHQRLANDPAPAFRQVTGRARNLEAQLAGDGLVGDNLGAALSAARTDALYAQVLFLFLGLPGAVLAGLLTATVAGAGRDRRRREQALLRTRGATVRQLVVLGAAEGALVGAVGSIVGLAVAAGVGRWAFGTTGFRTAATGTATWVAAAIAGLAVAAVAVALPACRDARRLTVVAARQVVSREREPRWMKAGLDLILVASAAVVFWLTSRTGYQLVLAVEGVPAISVSYWAFAAPALLWFGAGLMAVRLTHVLLDRGRPIVRRVLRPLSGVLADSVAATMQRERRLIARSVAIVALTTAFASSTAIFNATYRQQAEVDAVLTNGADVSVTASPGSVVSPGSAMATAVAGTPGVRHVEALQHRFAYVGSDLQDLYGVDPSTIVDAGKLQNGYFEGGTARDLIAILAARPDSVLVSAETVRDFQLLPGDHLTLRLQDGRTKQYVDVPFQYVGVVKEFPTAPSDSFLVANASYVASITGTDTIGSFLVDTDSADVTGVAESLRRRLGTDATVTDIVTGRRIIGSTLTAVDLRGLTRVELGAALALAAAATGLTLWLGLTERRRTFAIASALGAHPRHLRSFIWAEAGTVTVVGIAFGAVISIVVSWVLVKVLTGVFDPAPEHLAVPTAYLLTVIAIAVASSVAAAAAAVRMARVPHVELLRAV